MCRYFSVFALIFALVAALAPPRPALALGDKTVITGVRIGDHGATTRFVIEADKKLTFRIFTLASPYRVVIDLPEVAWRLLPGAGGTGRGLIEGFRFGLFAPGKSRVVLDMRSPVGVKKSFMLDPADGYGYRVVIDLTKVSRKTYMEQVKAVNRSRKVAALPMPAPKMSRPEKRRAGRVIVIDPGHGGVDPGTTGYRGSREKNITLAVARAVKARLEAKGRYRVVLTRERDIFLRLRSRVETARSAGADLFISLHADALKNRKVHGAAVYTLSEVSSDKEAAELAARENKADVIAGVDLTHENPVVANILIDLAQRETMNYSAQFATLLVAQLRRTGKTLRNAHRFAGFAVLKAPDIPSVLIEMGYLSNPKEERLLRQPAYQRKLADAIARAMDRYFEARK
ncbi:MAG: N-acetylmuramoyl-L-alanine amidase [Proteobacteria bacterium]|nr:N-acetylmuramoyl-L-alanine amidase [Pseudomonadota bacterium]